MQVEIDKFGRVLIPKAIRNHLGIKAGNVLELFEQDQEIHLRLVQQKTALKREGGLLVFTGEALEDFDNMLKKVRDERLDGID